MLQVLHQRDLVSKGFDKFAQSALPLHCLKDSACLSLLHMTSMHACMMQAAQCGTHQLVWRELEPSGEAKCSIDKVVQHQQMLAACCR